MEMSIEEITDYLKKSKKRVLKYKKNSKKLVIEAVGNFFTDASFVINDYELSVVLSSFDIIQDNDTEYTFSIKK